MHKQVSIKVRAYIIVYCPPLDCRLVSFRFVSRFDSGFYNYPFEGGYGLVSCPAGLARMERRL